MLHADCCSCYFAFRKTIILFERVMTSSVEHHFFFSFLYSSQWMCVCVFISYNTFFSFMKIKKKTKTTINNWKQKTKSKWNDSSFHSMAMRFVLPLNGKGSVMVFNCFSLLVCVCAVFFCLTYEFALRHTHFFILFVYFFIHKIKK